jgi:transposase
VDALGNPIGFHLTPGQACDLDGADTDTLLADKGYDADERVIERLEQQGKTVVIPPKRNRIVSREYDKDLYKARHLIENFFAQLKQYRAIAFGTALRAIATRYDQRARNFLGAIYLAAAVIWLN